jgi:hypothetical protein
MAVAAGGIFFFFALTAVFMMVSPMIKFIDGTARSLGFPRGGEFFSVTIFWTAVAFVISLLVLLAARKER